MKKSVRRALIIVMAMMCCLLVTVPVSAAKKPSKKTVAKAYEKFLKKHLNIVEFNIIMLTAKDK